MQGRRKGAAAGLTHVDAEGRARMVDVGDKAVTRREATARGEIRMRPETLRAIVGGRLPKGDVLAVARVAGILAAKRTHELVPMCHPLAITSIRVDFEPDRGGSRIAVEATVGVDGKTGVEMEALTAVSVAALTIYDMAKAIDRGMMIGRVRLIAKSGGKSGRYRAKR